VARIARTLRAQNSKVQIMCTDQCAVIPDFVKNAGAAANGTISTKIAGTALPPTPALRAFAAKYDKVTGTSAFPPPDWALGTYDAANILFSIWKRVGTDPTKVFQAWEKIKNYKGLSCGNISFSATQHNGLGDQSCYRLMIIKNQKPVLMPGQKT
jgi:ABC-type branched-subunit amino acid transport system substrate-binding protein